MFTRVLADLELSPKVVASTLLIWAASIALAIITGDLTYLLGLLVGAASGGAGIAAPAAVEPGRRPVKQSEVQRLARRVS